MRGFPLLHSHSFVFWAKRDGGFAWKSVRSTESILHSTQTLLKPTTSTTPLPGCSVPLLSIKEAPATVKQFYSCLIMTYVPRGGGEGGFVKGVVMDDLTVKPLSTSSSITLLNQFNIKDVLALEEKAVRLLKASVETDKVLTNVFLNVNK